MFSRRFVMMSAVAAVAVMSGAPIQAQAQDVKIGVVLSVTGGLAPFVPPIRAAAQLAAEQINAAGGVLGGRRIALVEVDDQTNPQAGVTAATRLVQVENVSAMVGPLASGVTIPVAQTVTIPAGVPLISPSATAPAISTLDDKDTVFRTVTPDGLQGRVLARTTRERGVTRVAALVVNNDYGRGLQTNFVAAFQEMGGTITSAANFEENRASYRAELATAAQTGNPEALLLIGYPASGGNTILRQALENGFFNRFIMTDGMRDGSVIQTIGAQNLANSFGTSGGSAAPADTIAKYAEAFKAKNPSLDPMGAFSPQMYDAVMTVALAIQKAGSTDRAAIARAIREVANGPGEVVGPGEFAKARDAIAAGRKINYDGASGPIEFNAAGDAAGAIDVWSVKGGAITVDATVQR
jgi:branched-chain amino acid transport system substrate-binding protein